MIIRNSTEKDFNEIMKIYEYARKFMEENGNPNQWGPTNWPPKNLIKNDIENSKSYVCIENNEIVGTFQYNFGKDIENTYKIITNGKWQNDEPYEVVHRLASNGKVKGIGKFCLNWAFEQSKHLRVDTHFDMLKKIITRDMLMKNKMYLQLGNSRRFFCRRKTYKLPVKIELL